VCRVGRQYSGSDRKKKAEKAVITFSTFEKVLLKRRALILFSLYYDGYKAQENKDQANGGGSRGTRTQCWNAAAGYGCLADTKPWLIDYSEDDK
jgi:hypothetical protein